MKTHARAIGLLNIFVRLHLSFNPFVLSLFLCRVLLHRNQLTLLRRPLKIKFENVRICFENFKQSCCMSHRYSAVFTCQSDDKVCGRLPQPPADKSTGKSGSLEANFREIIAPGHSTRVVLRNVHFQRLSFFG